MIKKLILTVVTFFSTQAFATIDWSKPIGINEFNSKKRISIVFASQNLASPMSMFGHTFLLAHDEVVPELDAIALEFLGKTEGIEWGHTKALATHIEGEFRLTNYFLKKREYNFEDRGLWIYELNLTPVERIRLQKHIEEQLKVKNLKYTFLNKNCSYYILNLLLSIRQSASDSSIYTLPKDTLHKLKSLGYIKEPPIYVEPEQLSLIHYLDTLNSKEQQITKQIVSGYSLAEGEASTRSKIASNMALTYKIPREPNPQIRIQYFNTKKKLLDDVLIEKNRIPPNDPVNSYGDASLRFGLETNTESAVLEGKFAQRDFYTSMNDGLSTSYLEVMKVKLIKRKTYFELSQLTLFKLDSLIASNEYRSPFNRLIDISFYQQPYKQNEIVKEYVLRYGHGISWQFSKVTLGLTPYLGLRHFHFASREGTEIDFGGLGRINYWISNSVSFESTVIKYLNTKTPLDYQFDFKLAVKLSPRWTFGAQNTYFPNLNNTEISFIYGF